MTERQARFVEAFLSGPDRVRYNATRAAEAVGYRWPGKQGPRLLSFPHVNEAVEAGFAAVCPVDRYGRFVEAAPKCM